METGVTYMNGQLSIGAGQAPSSSSNLISFGDVEVRNVDWVYYGDPSTDGSWRSGANGAADFLHQRREVGVWVTKQTISA